ncbi:copia protein, partial [Tanacetum coccineum]
MVKAVVTKSGQVPVNVAKQNSPRAAASISTVRPVNTDAPKSKVNDALPKTDSYFKAHAPIIKRLMVDLLHLQEVLKEFCRMKGIKREFSVARTPQQNRVAERKNRTLIEKEGYASSTNRDSNVSPSVSTIGTQEGDTSFDRSKLVAQGYTQEEGIDYDEVFAPVAKIESIRLFLAYALFMGLIVYQMDINSAFLYGTIEEEVYVCQPPGFEDPQFSDKVYVDDIIFGSIKNSLCVEFEQMMHKKFQMSSIGELTFFLGLQVMQKDDGIFISQNKYVADILKKFDFVTVKIASTPIETNKALLKDEEAEDVDVHLYRSMIGSLMYLIASRHD